MQGGLSFWGSNLAEDKSPASSRSKQFDIDVFRTSVVGNNDFMQRITESLGKSNFETLSHKEQVEIIKKSLQPPGRLIHPESRAAARWDWVLRYTCYYALIGIPVEVTFADLGYNWSFVLQRVMDVVLLCNFVLQFFLIFKENRVVPGLSSKHMIYCQDGVRIRRTYLQSWFAFDVLSLIPFDVIAMVAGDLDVLRFIRLIRWVHCFVILQMRMQPRPAFLDISYSMRSIIRLICVLLMYCHVVACLWAAVGIHAMNGTNDSWLNQIELKDYLQSVSKDNYWHVYVISYYWAMMTLVSVGYGDFVPSRVIEYISAIVFMLFGGLVWAYCIANVAAILSGVLQKRKEYEAEMDELRYISHTRNLPKALCIRLKMYFKMTSTQTKQLGRYQRFVGRLSPALYRELSVLILRHFVPRIWYLNKLESVSGSRNFLAEVATEMQTELLAPGERVAPNKSLLVLIDYGLVSHNGRVHGSKSALYIDFIIPFAFLKPRAVAVTLSFFFGFTLTAEVFLAVASRHPNISTQIRSAQMKMSLRELVLLNYRKKLANPSIISIEPVLRGREVSWSANCSFERECQRSFDNLSTRIDGIMSRLNKISIEVGSPRSQTDPRDTECRFHKSPMDPRRNRPQVSPVAIKITKVDL